MSERHHSRTDILISGFDQALRTLFGRPPATERPNPAAAEKEAELTEQERQRVARLMRVNHSGEVCAQGLYQGQALTAHLPDVREGLERAAAEENDHLDWCESRLRQLGNRKSLLNPLWYAGSFAMGAAAGLAGDKWSLGFVAETEQQVCDHLQGHITRLPVQDRKSRAILEQMKIDEARHASVALRGGGAKLPGPIRVGMRLVSKIMTRTAYWV